MLLQYAVIISNYFSSYCDKENVVSKKLCFVSASEITFKGLTVLFENLITFVYEKSMNGGRDFWFALFFNKVSMFSYLPTLLCKSWNRWNWLRNLANNFSIKVEKNLQDGQKHSLENSLLQW